MLFRLLDKVIPDVIYSMGVVARKIGAEKYEIKYGDASVIIYTEEILKKGEWVRFYGFRDGEVIACEFVQVLYNFDPTLVVKFIEMVSEK